MHIVAVTGYFYPYLTPSAGCVKHYLLELVDKNDIEVVCPPSSTRYKKSIEREGIKINYVNNLSNSILSFIKTCQEEGKYPLFIKVLFTIYRGMRFIKYSFCRKPYRISMVDRTVRMLESINKKNPIDVLISVTFPYHNHVVALQYKKKNPSVRWISFSTDPLAYSESNPIEKWKLKEAKKIEKEVYSKCDHCVVTQELVSNVIKDYDISPSKVTGFPFLLFNKEIRHAEEPHERPMLLYAGLVFYKVRNPQIMLNVFSGVKDADLYLYISGDRHCREILNRPYPSQIKMHGYVSHERYMELLAEADVFINLGNKARLQAPHKLMELVSTGKPIINFYYYEDTGVEIIEKYPLGINISNELNIEEMQKIVDGFVKENYKRRMTFDKVKDLYPEHLLANQLPKMESIILNS